MKFLHIAFMDKGQSVKQTINNQALRPIHKSPIEHAIVWWIQQQQQITTEIIHLQTYYLFTKEDIENFFNTCNVTDAEREQIKPRPWLHLPIPKDESTYAYQVAEYEKEYATVYYDAVYKYMNVLSVILNIFDFDSKQIVIYVK